jgi:EAL domain-containing protein (putative c-di-GMP-specific phosphodiesterase class I)
MHDKNNILMAITLDENGTHTGRFNQFILHSSFQPIFSIHDNGLILYGYEGLVRPYISGNPVPLSDLFDQQNHQDRHFVDQLCRALHIRNFPQIATANTLLFLNLDPAAFNHPGQIIQDVDWMLSHAISRGLDPSCVVCEILENNVAEQNMIDTLCLGLRGNGFKLAIDDYGRNASNWQRFSRVQPQILKLDGAVFRNLCKSLFATRALQTLIEHLRDVDCKLLIEGIENDLQFDIALNAGVTLLQGYYLAAPQTMPIHPRSNAMPFPPEIASVLHTQRRKTA